MKAPLARTSLLLPLLVAVLLSVNCTSAFLRTLKKLSPLPSRRPSSLPMSPQSSQSEPPEQPGLQQQQQQQPLQAAHHKSPSATGQKPANMTTSTTTAGGGATAAAFDLLIDTIQQLSVVMEEKQEMSKEEVLDRLDDWMGKLDRDFRGVHSRLEKINKDVNRATILLVVGFGITLASAVPGWWSASK